MAAREPPIASWMPKKPARSPTKQSQTGRCQSYIDKMEFEEPENDSMDEDEEQPGFEFNDDDDGDEFDEEDGEDEESYVENAVGVALWRAAVSGNHQEISHLLQTTDVDPNYKHYTAPQYDEFLRPITPLFAACSRGQSEAVRALLADPRTAVNFRLENGASALHFAAIFDSVDCLRLVLDAKNPPQIEAGERSALHYACLRGQIAAANFLIERGSPIDSVDFCGQTPLFYAAYQGKTAMCKFLVSKGANPNMVDQDGEIPLFDAALAGMLSTVQYFVEETNANLLHTDNQGRTAFDVADAAQMSEVALYLWRKGVPSNQLKKSSFVLSTSRLYPIDGPGASVGLNAGIAGKTLYLCGGQRLVGSEVTPIEDMFNADISQIKAINLLGHYGVELPPPTELSPHRIGQLLQLLDPHRVRYVGNESDWAASVQSTRPSTVDDGIMYFEVLLADGGTRNEIAIGISHGDYSINDDLPGWNPISWALHGDNGNVYHNNGYGHGWATRVFPGDTVGCGLIRKSREIFFTLNGQFLGVAFVVEPEELNRDLFPTVGLRGDGSEVSVNFGDKPFKFDFYVDALQFHKSRGFVNKRRHIFAANKYFVSPSKGLGALHRFDAESGKLERIPVTCDSPLPQADNERFRTCAIGSTLWVYVVPSQPKKSKKPMNPVFKLWSIDVETGKAEKHSIDLTQMQRDLPPALDVGVDLLYSGNRIYFFQPDEFCSFYVDVTTLQATEIFPEGSFSPELESVDLGVAILAQKHSVDGEAGNSTVFSLYEPKYNDWLSPRLSGPTVRQRVGTGIAAYDNTVFFISGYSDDHLLPDFDVCSLRDSSSMLMDSLQIMFESPVLSDVQLQFPGGQSVFCHKAILHARCSALRESLSRNESCQIAIDVPFSLFRHILKYIYTDTMDLNIDAQMTLSLADLFDKWIPEHALRACESIVLTRVAIPSSMSRDIGAMALNPLYSDIVLVVDGQEIVAHRCILARCGYFRAMFTGQLKEATQNRVEIPETSLESFKIVLDYIYTQDSDPTEYAEIIVDVLITAARFGVEKLVHLLEGVIAHNLSVENACSLLVLAQQGFLRLGAAAKDFVRRHKLDIQRDGHWLAEADEIVATM